MVAEITLPDGQQIRIEAKQVLITRLCPHCDLPFTTNDPRKIYPNKNHADMDRRYRRIIHEMHA